jgi:hypothetical protein
MMVLIFSDVLGTEFSDAFELSASWVHFQALQEVMQGVLYDPIPEVTLTFVLLLPQETSIIFIF